MVTLENTRRNFIKHVTAAGLGVAGLTFAERTTASVDNATEMYKKKKSAGKDEGNLKFAGSHCQEHIS